MRVITQEESAEEVSRRERFELSALDPLERVLLTSDGTLTDTLAALYLESISVVVLGQRLQPAPHRLDLLALAEGELVLERRVLLRGEQSGRHYVCADSLVAMDRLAPSLRKALLTSNAPLGLLWKASATEIFKQVIQRDRVPAGARFERLRVHPESSVLTRTYRVYCNRRPVALITEHIVPPSMRGVPRDGGRASGDEWRLTPGVSTERVHRSDARSEALASARRSEPTIQ